jgi:hypothetical protein
MTFTPSEDGPCTASVAIASNAPEKNPYLFRLNGQGLVCGPDDVNCDGAINIFDLQVVINCILGSGDCNRCDLSGDGLHNIFDLQLVINKILGG